VQRAVGRGQEGKHRNESSKEGDRRVGRWKEKLREGGNKGRIEKEHETERTEGQK
jgi:hypothetical protein